MKKTYSVLALAATALCAGAQDQLNKEITIEREIVPELRAASRLNIYPQLQQVGFKPITLMPSERTDATNIPGMITTLEPAKTLPAMAPTPYRGYVDAGYFPAADFGLSAGYTIVSSESTRLNVWGQLNRNGYKQYPTEDSEEKESFNRLDGVLGIGFQNRFGETGTLSLSTDFGYTTFNRHFSEETFTAPTNDKVDDQAVMRWNVDALWNGNIARKGTYHAGLRFGLFNFSKDQLCNRFTSDIQAIQSLPFVVDPVHEMNFGLTAGFAASVNSTSAFGLGVDADFNHYNSFLCPSTDDIVRGSFRPDLQNEPSGKTLGVISFTPHFRYAGKVAEVKLGLRADISAGGSGKTFHIAPDVLLAANPSQHFGVWLKAGGGEHLNSMESLFGFTPYFSPMFAYENSNLPITGQFGLRIGGFYGATLKLAVSYAKANNWLLPAMTGGDVVFMASDVKALRLETGLTWALRSWIDLSVGYNRVLGKESDIWYEWRDAARSELTAALTVRPIENLSVDLGYSLKSDRRMANFIPDSEGSAELVTDLKNLNSLSVGASYRFTEQFTVFARGENLLNEKAYLLTAHPAQGIHGLVGVGFKF